jgi:hypothetical protein
VCKVRLVCVFVCVCVRARAFVYTWLEDKYLCMQACMHTGKKMEKNKKATRKRTQVIGVERKTMYVCMSMYVRMIVYLYIYVSISVFMYVCSITRVIVGLCMCVNEYVCMHVCMYWYIYLLLKCI